MTFLLKRAVPLALLLYLSAWGYRVIDRKYYIWLPDYFRWSMQQAETPTGPTHLIFFFVDNFEPAGSIERMRRWEREYPLLAKRHLDSTGRPVQHTWFYPADDPYDVNMLALQRLAAARFGEVELHLHHLRDDHASALRKYRSGIRYFQRFGFLKTRDGKTRFAFVHGNGGLDNSLGPSLCGVSDELSLLRELGCFADFSFPAVWAESQPAIVNTIYMATDDDRPKSYNRGVPLRAGVQPAGDLLIFPGPLVFAPALDPRRLFLPLENGDIHASLPLTARRVDTWVRANIHVEGRPEWVFLKVTSHGAASDGEVEEVLGPDFDHALSHLEKRYNDGSRYVLHYVTAREAYNIARAAAAGKTGDPQQYLNWEIPQYEAGAVPRT